jgi:hypothetical protein
MLNFYDYLTEAADKPLSSNTGSIKTRGHIVRYIMPYLSSENKKQSIHELNGFLTDSDIQKSKQDSHGELHDPRAKTHVMASSHGGHKKGTGVKLKSLYRNNDTIMARTEKHGDMPISKLGTPGELAAEPKTKEGFALEHILQRNVDPRYKPAGSSGGSYDFVAGDPDSDSAVKGKAVKKDETPLFRGESKNSQKGNVAMGTISAVHNKQTGKWEYTSKTISKMQPIFEKARHENGKSIIDHLNDIAPDGKLKKGFNVKAVKGTTNHYLKAGGVNALHIHRYSKNEDGVMDKNYGTTYTVGKNNIHENELGLGHLNEKQLNDLDGQIHIEASGEGKVQLKHRPPAAAFNKFADASIKDPWNHRDLSREDHAEEFRKKYSDHVQKLRNMFSLPTPQTKQKAAAVKPVQPAAPDPDADLQRAENEGMMNHVRKNSGKAHGGRNFYD